MYIEKTNKFAQTNHGLKPITIRKHQKIEQWIDKDGDKMFDLVWDENGNPVYDGYEIIAISNSPNHLSAHRSFGIFDTLEEARKAVAQLPDIVE